MRLGAFLAVAVAAAGPSGGAGAQEHKLACPPIAPAEWRLPNARLASVEVLAAAEGEAIDETAPPSLVPDGQSLRSGTLRQSWQMNVEGPGTRYFVDCGYAGTARRLRLPADGVTRCERTITHFTKDRGATPSSEERMVCD